MKVLFYRYRSILEPDIMHTFDEFGLETVAYEREMTVKDDTPAESVKHFSRFLMENPCDFIFSINFFPHVSEVAQIFHLRYVTWVVDAPVLELYTKMITNSCNRVFIFDKALYDEIHPLNPDCVFHLHLAGSVSSRREIIEHPGKGADRFAHPVAFVGSLYSEKDPMDQVHDLDDYTRGYLEGIMSAQEKVYGYYFIDELLTDEVVAKLKRSLPVYQIPEESFLTDEKLMSLFYIGNHITAMERADTFRRLSDSTDTYIYTGSDTSAMPAIHNMGLANTLLEMPLIFNRSMININTTSKAIRTGLPLRIFDILSCGGFCISNYQEEIAELFTPGEEIVMYSSIEELCDLVAYYLDHDREREEIARAGYEKLRNNYTYEITMQQLLYKAFEK
jgi:spore maturation protein CgeB